MIRYKKLKTIGEKKQVKSNEKLKKNLKSWITGKPAYNKYKVV